MQANDGAQPDPTDRGRVASPEHLTAMIAAARTGDPIARDQLFDAVYHELKVLARATPYVARAGETLQATAVTNEVFLELCRRFPPPPAGMRESRATFFRSVALAMRRIVYEHWRARQAEKRNAGRPVASLEHSYAAASVPEADATTGIALEEALTELEQFNRRWHDVVCYRHFAGRSIKESAELLGVAESTVSSDWQLARGWLARRLGGGSESVTESEVKREVPRGGSAPH